MLCVVYKNTPRAIRARREEQAARSTDRYIEWRSIDLLAAVSAFAAAAPKVPKTALGNCCHGNSSAATESTEKLALNRFVRPSDGGSNSVQRVVME